MCCDATHVVRRSCSRSYLACCTCTSAWQKCPIEPLGKESGWLLWRATELRTPFFFRPLNGHIFWNRAEKNGTHFCVPMGGSGIYIYNRYTIICIYIYVYLFLSRNNMKLYSRYSYIIRCFDCVYLRVCAQIHAYDTVCMWYGMHMIQYA